MPFRNRATLPNLVRAGRTGSACAPRTDMQFVSLPGKPQAFRTAGGKAALGLANLDTIGVGLILRLIVRRLHLRLFMVLPSGQPAGRNS